MCTNDGIYFFYSCFCSPPFRTYCLLSAIIRYIFSRIHFILHWRACRVFCRFFVDSECCRSCSLDSSVSGRTNTQELRQECEEHVHEISSHYYSSSSLQTLFEYTNTAWRVVRRDMCVSYSIKSIILSTAYESHVNATRESEHKHSFSASPTLLFFTWKFPFVCPLFVTERQIREKRNVCFCLWP